MASRADFNQQYTTTDPTGRKPPGYKSTMHVDAVHSGYDMDDYQQQQGAHYRAGHGGQSSTGFLPNYGRDGNVPMSSYSRYPRPGDQAAQAAYNEKATRRKPVNTYDPKLGPQAPSHKHSVSAEEIGLKAPTSRPEPVAAGSPSYINTTPDGRFDPGTIRPGTPERMDMPPTSFDASKDFWPPGGMPERMEMPATSFDSDGTPGSDDRKGRPHFKRRDSVNSMTESIKSIGSNIRRGSAELARGVGKFVKLAKKRPVERDYYTKTKEAAKHDSARQRSAERESACRDNPGLRPPHEQERLRFKNYQRFEQERAEGKHPLHESNPYAPDLSQQMREAERRARAEERNAKYRQAENAKRASKPTVRVDTQQASGGDEPPSPSDSFHSSASLTPSERAMARESYGMPRRRTSDPLDGWEKAGANVGKLLDPVRRKYSEDSEFFGDEAMPGAMDNCSSCNQPPEHFLTAGICEHCMKQAKKQKGYKW